MTVWRQWLEGRDPAKVGKMLGDAGLKVVSLCRGGFFPAADAAGRQAAIDDNLRAIDEAEALGPARGAGVRRGAAAAAGSVARRRSPTASWP